MAFTHPQSSSDVKLAGLSNQQEEVCLSALQAFLERHGLDSWGLTLNLSDAGNETWRLDASVVAPPEFDFSVRSTHVLVDRSLDLAPVVDLCLETHYNACMNRKAMSQPAITRKASQPQQAQQARAKAV
jgi:hypothetical protein